MSIKLKLLMFCLILLTAAACEKENENPEVELLNGEWMIANTSIAPGGLLKFKWRVTRGKSSLESFTLRLDGQDLPGFPNTDLPPEEYIDSTLLEGPLNPQSYVYSFLATDEDGRTGNKTLIITVE